MTPSRGEFLVQGAIGTAVLATLPILAPAQSSNLQSKVFISLGCGRIDLTALFPKSVELVITNRFEGVDPDQKYFSTRSDEELQRLLQDLEATNLRIGAGGLPVDFRKDETKFKRGLTQLPDIANSLKRAGAWRVSTSFSSSSSALSYLQNFRSHATRQPACCEFLKHHGQKLGPEHVGPMTSWRRGNNSFIHWMNQIEELIAAIGNGNVCIHMDSWH
jgi:sugar phosphate isomerase/epimerase